jgi:hypothetical protein
MNTHAPPTPSSAAASTHGAASPSIELLEARQLRDALKLLLRKEQAAMAEFLVALADFDRSRGWEVLGHASLFAFLVVELGLSTSSTYWRKSAAELLQDFPELEQPLRQGRLCLTTMAELAKVLTEENKEAVLPRFLGISSREAKEVVAELQPREAPPLRAVVTTMPPAISRPSSAILASARRSAESELRMDWPQRDAPDDTDPASFRAPEMEMTHPARVAAPRNDVEPLTADLRRLHITVSRQFLTKLDAARDGLSRTIPGATMEQVLEAALDLLLKKQARARGQVRGLRTAAPVPVPSATVTATATVTMEAAAHPASESPRSVDVGAEQPLVLTEPPPPRREGPRGHVPAAVRRAVWERDGDRCTWPLDGGGVCGSTHRLEIDHIVPWARFSEPTVENLRVVCHAHNTLAARQVFGARCVERYARARRRPGRGLRPVE